MHCDHGVERGGEERGRAMQTGARAESGSGGKKGGKATWTPKNPPQSPPWRVEQDRAVHRELFDWHHGFSESDIEGERIEEEPCVKMKFGFIN